METTFAPGRDDIRRHGTHRRGPNCCNPDCTNQTAATDRAVPGTTPAVQLSFRVDEAIAGVERGQILTIHEWAGAWSMHRPMSKGQHILIFLYPPSRLGLTSPVGGSLGQVALDASGKNVSKSQGCAERAAPKRRWPWP